MDFIKNGKNRNIMLLNVLYNRGNPDTKWVDTLTVIYKDLDTGKIEADFISKPKIDGYIVKEEFQNYRYNKQFEYLDRCDKYELSYKNLPFEIAKLVGGRWQEYLMKLKDQREFYAMKEIHKQEYVFGTDMDITNLYRAYWNIEYGTDNIGNLTKGFLDIEVDGINVVGFPQPGECPINAITLIDSDKMISHTFLLRNHKIPAIDTFEDEIDEFRKELANDFDNIYGKIEYKFYMYNEEDEIRLIIDLFKVINTIKLNFIAIWNMDFDIPFIIARIKELGFEPDEVMTHPDFPYKNVYYRKDKNNFKVENKSDVLDISSYTYFMCQMINYAALRKGGSELRSNKLGYTAQKEMGEDKLDYSEVANIKTLPYVNYKMFVKYNISDEDKRPLE